MKRILWLCDPPLGKLTVGGFQTTLDLSAVSLESTVVDMCSIRTIEAVTDVGQFLLTLPDLAVFFITKTP